jgi:ATP-dependent DNA helicase DinG
MSVDLTDLWGPYGPVSQACRKLGVAYQPREPQRQMATVVASALDRQTANMGQIVPIEAATGTGKTLAYLVPCALHAAATKDRVLVSTHTIALGKQILHNEGPIVQELIASLHRHHPRIAHMRGRRHFVSPSRLAAIANLMQDDGVSRAMLEPYRSAIHQVHEALDKAQDALDDEHEHSDVQRLIEACLIDQIEEQFGLKLDREETCLLSSSPDQEKTAHALSRSLADNADILVTTHAYTALSLARNQLFEAENSAFDSLTIDEADQWASAAASVTVMRISLSGLRRSIEAVIAASSRLQNKDRIVGAVRGALDALQNLAALAPTERGSRTIIEPGDPALAGLRKLANSLERIKHETTSKRTRLAAAVDDISEKIEMLARLDRAVSRKNSDYWTARWTTSHVTGAPTIDVVGRAPGRVLKRLWERPEAQDPLARTIILTSATLATPGFATDSRWRSIEIATGIDPAAPNVLSDLATTIEPREFGTLRFRFADPNAPIPRVSRTGKVEQAAIDYGAAVIRAAQAHVQPQGRTLVLVPAYEDVDRLAPLVPGSTPHRKGVPLSDMLDVYIKTPGICLITPAAWIGANLPGMVQALVIPRLPYPPSETDEPRMVAVISEMLTKLAQGIGRAIRRPDDDATIWFADPRMPIPECITEQTGILPSAAANPVALTAIPRRFRNKFSRVEGMVKIGLAYDRPPSTAHRTIPKASQRKTKRKSKMTSWSQAGST